MNDRSQRTDGKAAIVLTFVVTVAAVLAFGPYSAHKLHLVRTSTVEHVRVQADIELLLKTGLALYKSFTGSYPTTQQGLAALVSEPRMPPFPSKWIAFLSAVPKDPWGNDYVYLCPGQSHPEAYDLYSSGPDRIANTADDDWGK